MISVVIPVYNAEKTIRETIDSVMSQTFKDYEIILVDDNSRDKSLKMISDYIEDHPCIRVFANVQNYGPGKCRNIGIAAAKGEYIAFLDADDKWKEDKLEKQLELAKDHPEAVLFYTGSTIIDDSGRVLMDHLEVKEEVTRRELLKQNIIPCSSVMVKKNVLKDSAFSDDRKCHEDLLCWLEILKLSGKAYGINEPLLVYRMTEGSKSSNKLKSARMNWNTYRLAGLGFFEAVYYMIFYALNGIIKLVRIKTNKEDK